MAPVNRLRGLPPIGAARGPSSRPSHSN
jgi:hypothetical protein